MGKLIQTGGAVVVALGLQLAGTAGSAHGALTPAQFCEKTITSQLTKCVKKVAGIQRNCFKKENAICDKADPTIVKALDKLSDKVTDKCVNDTTVQSAGFSSLTLASLLDRLQASCIAETESLVARSYGGPHGSAWADAAAAMTEDEKEAQQGCIDALMNTGRKVVSGVAKTQMKCIDKESRGKTCDATKTGAKVAKLVDKSAQKITKKCGSVLPEDLVTLDAADFAARAASQGECLTAIGKPDTNPLELSCGPRTSIPVPARGAYEQVVLDHATWGTKCGDGSDYAFQIRLAPAGHPVENVVVQMQGGGVCIFASQCSGVSSDLFEATSDTAPTSGIMSNSSGPFANWTKVFLPYCNQDVFIGGGATNDFSGSGGPVVERYGAINVRAALRYVRDVVWNVLDQDSEGYRHDRMNVLFGGTSAGGFGTLYNYHYVLDDLQWIHSTAWPDAALALDSGDPLFSIVNLGVIAIPSWESGPHLPPYCFSGNCAEGEAVYAASAPRLKREPRQQFLVLSNQVDNTQVSTTFFPDQVSWINKMRQSYCDTAGTTGLHYYLTPISSSVHVIGTVNSIYNAIAAPEQVDGIALRDWLGDAMTNPGDVEDAVAEGDLTTAISGVNAFPCSVD